MALLKLVFLEGQRANSFFQGTPPFNRKTKGFSGIRTQDRAWARHWRLSPYQYTTATYPKNITCKILPSHFSSQAARQIRCRGPAMLTWDLEPMDITVVLYWWCWQYQVAKPINLLFIEWSMGSGIMMSDMSTLETLWIILVVHFRNALNRSCSSLRSKEQLKQRS